MITIYHHAHECSFIILKLSWFGAGVGLILYLPRHVLNYLLVKDFKHKMIWIPMCSASLHGTAFPICLYCWEMEPQNCQLSGKD